MQHRAVDNHLAIDPAQGYWSSPPQPMIGSGWQRIAWTHPQLVEERMLAIGATGLRTMALRATTRLARLSAYAVAAAHLRTASRGEVAAL